MTSNNPAEHENISLATFIRWLIPGMAAVILTGGSVWLNNISKQIDRIEENLSVRITKLEQSIDAIKQSEQTGSEKYSSRIVDLQIENKMYQLRIENLERGVEQLQQHENLPFTQKGKSPTNTR